MEPCPGAVAQGIQTCLGGVQEQLLWCYRDRGGKGAPGLVPVPSLCSPTWVRSWEGTKSLPQGDLPQLLWAVLALLVLEKGSSQLCCPWHWEAGKDHLKTPALSPSCT